MSEPVTPIELPTTPPSLLIIRESWYSAAEMSYQEGDFPNTGWESDGFVVIDGKICRRWLVSITREGVAGPSYYGSGGAIYIYSGTIYIPAGTRRAIFTMNYRGSTSAEDPYSDEPPFVYDWRTCDMSMSGTASASVDIDPHTVISQGFYSNGVAPGPSAGDCEFQNQVSLIVELGEGTSYSLDAENLWTIYFSFSAGNSDAVGVAEYTYAVWSWTIECVSDPISPNELPPPQSGDPFIPNPSGPGSSEELPPADNPRPSIDDGPDDPWPSIGIGHSLSNIRLPVSAGVTGRILLRDRNLNVIGIDDSIISFECSRVENSPGAFSMVTPMCAMYENIDIDYVVELQRSFDGGKTWINDLETAWFVRAFTIQQEGPKETVVIAGHDSVGLLERRLLSWFTVKNTEIEQNYYSIKYMPADKMMIEVVKENLTPQILLAPPDDIPGSVSAMNISSKIFPYFEVNEVYFSGVPVVKAEFAWKSVLDALKTIAEAALQESCRLVFDMKFIPRRKIFSFVVRPDILGEDRSKTILFSAAAQNISSISMVKDHANEATWIHVGGEGQNDLKLYHAVGSSSEPDWPFYPIEAYVDAQNSKNDPDILNRRGLHELAMRKPRWIFKANVIDVPWCRFGFHYKFGDRVSIQHRGITSTCRISQVRLSYENKKFNIEIPLETEESI